MDSMKPHLAVQLKRFLTVRNIKASFTLPESPTKAATGDPLNSATVGCSSLLSTTVDLQSVNTLAFHRTKKLLY